MPAHSVVATRDTVLAWCDAIETLIVTGATTSKIDAGNIGIKNIKGTGSGFCHPVGYRARTLLSSSARTTA